MTVNPRWKVSIAAMMMRCKQLEIIDDTYSVCVFHGMWPPSPRQTGHPVHAKLGHSFHAMADNRSVATRGVSFYYVCPVPVN